MDREKHLLSFAENTEFKIDAYLYYAIIPGIFQTF